MTVMTWNHRMFLGLLACGLTASCVGGDKRRGVVASDSAASRLVAGDGTRPTGIPCGEPQVTIIKTIDWFDRVHGGNDWYNDFFTPLAHHKGYTYWVWRDSEFNVFVSKIDDNGHMESHRLGGDGYQSRRDAHNLFSLAVDQDGYIHVTGDMQNGPNEPKDVDKRNADLYPKEYLGAQILYWRSHSPENVQAGFEFRGHEDDERRIRAYSANGIRFFKDNNGVLYSSAAVKAIKGSNSPGSRGIGLYRYHTDSQTWETIGAPMPGDSYDVFFGEFGSEGDDFFNGYFHSFMFDAANRMHFATPVATTAKRLDGYDRLIYAYSDDSGSHWKKANDQAIGGLPLRGADSEDNQGEVVGPRDERYSWHVKLVPDRHGRPGLRVKQLQQDKNVWWVRDGNGWTLNNTINNQSDAPHTGSVGPGGTMILHRNESPLKMQCVGAYGEQPSTTLLDRQGAVLDGYHKLLYIDEYALRTTGVAYGIASKTNGSDEPGEQSLVRIAYQPQAQAQVQAPLRVPVPAPAEVRGPAQHWKMGDACVEPLEGRLGIGTCDDTPKKRWVRKHLDGETLAIVHDATGECLTAGGEHDGAALFLSGCTDAGAQKFKYHDHDLVLVDRFCVDLDAPDGGNAAASSKIHLWTCAGTWNQKWSFQ